MAQTLYTKIEQLQSFEQGIVMRCVCLRGIVIRYICLRVSWAHAMWRWLVAVCRDLLWLAYLRASAVVLTCQVSCVSLCEPNTGGNPINVGAQLREVKTNCGCLWTLLYVWGGLCKTALPLLPEPLQVLVRLFRQIRMLSNPMLKQATFGKMRFLEIQYADTCKCEKKTYVN